MKEFKLITPTRRRRKNAMAKAKRDHRALIALLGNKCAICEETWETTHLQIDHVDGREKSKSNSVMRGKRWDVRVKQYWREFWHGVRLRTLCIECNGRDGQRRQHLEEAPF